MNILDLLKGKEIIVPTNMKVDVKLKIEKVEERHHSEELGPSTPENDWWPPTRDWVDYKVTFTNGASKTYNSLNEIKIIE